MPHALAVSPLVSLDQRRHVAIVRIDVWRANRRTNCTAIGMLAEKFGGSR
jgi:hypothetical protein